MSLLTSPTLNVLVTRRPAARYSPILVGNHGIFDGVGRWG
jgi:hypothetical protein